MPPKPTTECECGLPDCQNGKVIPNHQLSTWKNVPSQLEPPVPAPTAVSQMANALRRLGGDPPPHEEAQGWEQRFNEAFCLDNDASILYSKKDAKAIRYFIHDLLSSSTKAAYEEGYKRGVEDEIECVKTSGEHLDLQKLLSPQSPDQGSKENV